VELGSKSPESVKKKSRVSKKQERVGSFIIRILDLVSLIGASGPGWRAWLAGLVGLVLAPSRLGRRTLGRKEAYKYYEEEGRWVSSGTVLDAELLPWPRQHLGRRAVFSAAFHHAERAPRVASSLTADSPTIRSLKTSLVPIQGFSPPMSCAQGRLVKQA
jgi:hypothetical protein